SDIVRQCKTCSARRVNQWHGMVGQPVWQRNDYEHIIRDETSLQRIREYIAANPNQWAADHENRRGGFRTRPYDGSDIVRQCKTCSARRVNQWRGMVGQPVWQRNITKWRLP
ncbi:MAG: hypothetical protein ACUVSZ_12660, partial [Chloroflexus sp.]